MRRAPAPRAAPAKGTPRATATNAGRLGPSAAGRVHAATRDFLPGMSNSFSWNTTIPVEQKPILVYIFRCSAVDGEDFEYSSELESRSLGEEKVRRLAREFICEKVCLSDEEFLREVEGREAVSRYLETLGKPEERRAHLALLDFQGNALATIDEKGARRGAKVMAAEMRGCLEENARRAAEFQVQGDS